MKHAVVGGMIRLNPMFVFQLLALQGKKRLFVYFRFYRVFVCMLFSQGRGTIVLVSIGANSV